jgi:hypothetical protein
MAKVAVCSKIHKYTPWEEHRVFLTLNPVIHEIITRFQKVNKPRLQLKLHRKTGGPF